MNPKVVIIVITKGMKATYLLTLALLLVALQAQGLTFQPPPPITPRTVFSFSNSTVDGALIASTRLEFLNLELITVPSVATNVTLTVFNRSDTPTMKTSRSVILPGNWYHVESSLKSLSCSVFYETNTNVVGMLRWSRVNGTFSLLGGLPISAFTNDTVTIDQIRQAITVG